MPDAKDNFWPRNLDSYQELLAERRGKKSTIKDPVMKAILDFDEEKLAQKPIEKKFLGLFDGSVKSEKRKYIF